MLENLYPCDLLIEELDTSIDKLDSLIDCLSMLLLDLFDDLRTPQNMRQMAANLGMETPTAVPDPATGARVTGEMTLYYRNVQETLAELNRLGREADTEHARLMEKQKEYGGRIKLDETADPIQEEGFRNDIPKIMGKRVRGQELTPDELLVWNKYKEHLADPSNLAMQLRKQQVDIVEEAQAFAARRTDEAK